MSEVVVNRLTAIDIMPVTMPVLIVTGRYLESKLRSIIDIGLIPFFRYPICNTFLSFYVNSLTLDNLEETQLITN